ncbi:hypothetical protein C9374_009333 [Naegleria lovaniensis]|uniref:Phosphodiesterase n=1 Tax=Naegleria lovaniensis TaxID=51637 RepID=A0AA88GDG8_NAELO|nr:uncharacterized protein C9374_009333 [Naegleria lovaniensis]KAG2377422.1 hypothetical protein C9374_009333 [Naegleria lovaniensis]
MMTQTQQLASGTRLGEERKLSLGSSSERRDSVTSSSIPQLLTDSNIVPNILVIDDDLVTRKTLSKLLSNLGYKCTTAAGGKEALSLLLRDDDDPFHCLLVDVMMPEMDGFGFIRVLKQAINREIPCIMMSGSEDPETVSKSFQYGAEDFLPKPIKEEILRARIQTVLAYRDRRIRERFYINKIVEEQRLRNQLHMQEKKNEEELMAFKKKVGESIETPIQLIVSTVGDIMSGSLDREQTKLALISVMKSLSSSNLYRPAFLDSLKTTEMDESTRHWLVNQYTKDAEEYNARRHSINERSNSLDSGSSSDSTTNNYSSTLTLPNAQTNTSILTKPEAELPFNLDTYKPDVDLKSLNYDAFKYSDYEELKKHVMYFFKSLNMFETFNIKPYKLWAFLSELRKKYRANFYHNFRHCCDVTQYLYVLINNEKIDAFFSNIEKLVLLVSGLTHDIDHPGVNNNFLIATEDELAYRYNDKSVLENYHAFNAFKILQKDECNFLDGLSEEQFRECRKCLVQTILATDMSNHFSIISIFESRIGTGRLSNENAEDRILLMRVLMKCSDISNLSRPFPIAKKWANACINEFFSQGDLERQKGLPISPLMDRNTLDFPKSQMDFGKFVVAPLFKLLCAAFKELTFLHESVLNNIETWRHIYEEEQAKKALAAANSTTPSSTAAIVPPQESSTEKPEESSKEPTKVDQTSVAHAEDNAKASTSTTTEQNPPTRNDTVTTAKPAQPANQSNNMLFILLPVLFLILSLMLYFLTM